jgi:hypothetical protein
VRFLASRKGKATVNQISPEEGSDLLHKLFSEQLPVVAFFTSTSRARIRLDGFVVGATRDKGLFIGNRALPADPTSFIDVFPFGEGECRFLYGDRSEGAAEIRSFVTEDNGVSALVMRFIVSEELLVLFFTI